MFPVHHGFNFKVSVFEERLYASNYSCLFERPGP